MRQDFNPMQMGTRLARNWWAVALRGVAAILLGLIALLWPAITLSILMLLLAAFAFVGGILLVISAIRDGLNHSHAWTLLIEGIIGIAVGILAFSWPGMTALFLLYLIAAWAIFTGIFEIVASLQIRREIANEWLLAIAGVASVIFGFLLIVWPVAGAVALLWVIAIYAIIFGFLLLSLAVRLRNWSHVQRGI